MTYEVIRYFVDLLDDNHEYHEGDTYPRTGYKPTESRCEELSGYANKQHTPLIKAAEKAAEDAVEDISEKPVEVKAEDKPKRRRKK